MEYRKFENLGVSPSLLGFGCMRFPQTADGNIDEAKAESMLDRALKAGVTYIDTAYPYHNGDSEPFVGRVLKKYDRKSFYLATKLPVWNVKTLDDAKRIFQEQLDRLEVDYVDFYLLHCLDKEKWQNVLDLGIIPYMEEMKKEGKIKFFGFSFHDDFETFKTIATYRKWDFCQIQYNYVDTDIQAGDKGYELTEELGIPLVIMEPVKGGSLATLPDAVTEPFKDYKPNASISSWALRWVASKPNVKVVLSGMTTMEQVEDNLNTFENFTPLNLKEKEIVADVASAIKQRTKNGCTGCAYCMPCPFGVNIPQNFRIWNDLSMYENKEQAKRAYFNDLAEDARADQCQKCGKCEEVCPQAMSIRDDLERVKETMEKL